MVDPKLVWTSTDTLPPDDMFHRDYDEEPLESRVLVAVEGYPEPYKGRCLKNHSGTIKWQADGFMGDFNIKYWMPLPKVPHG